MPGDFALMNKFVNRSARWAHDRLTSHLSKHLLKNLMWGAAVSFFLPPSGNHLRGYPLLVAGVVLLLCHLSGGEHTPCSWVDWTPWTNNDLALLHNILLIGALLSRLRPKFLTETGLLPPHSIWHLKKSSSAMP